MRNKTVIKLRIPHQDLVDFTPFALNPQAAAVWAQGLPVTNTRLVAQQLKRAINELNRVELPADNRFQIMEVLRPNLHVALSTLAKRFLNQPLVLPEEPQQMLELSNTLTGLATTAYSSAAIHTIQQQGDTTGGNPARRVCESLHRALSFAGQKMLRTLQLHQPIELHGWLELHQLYALAESQQLTELPVLDEFWGVSSIRNNYLRTLILGCCNPNQLRQTDLSAIHYCLLEWSEHLKLSEVDSDNGLFVVDLDSDSPPVYNSLRNNSTTSCRRFIDTSGLITHLELTKEANERKGRNAVTFDANTSIPFNILSHLISSLGTMSTRNFRRSSEQQNLQIGTGLSNAHYYVAGGKTFEQVLYGDTTPGNGSARHLARPFIQPPEQQYSQQGSSAQESAPEDRVDEPQKRASLTLVAEQEIQEPSPEQRFPVYNMDILNASPGGYCLEWCTGLPLDTRAGDIICVRDGSKPTWDIAVMRWISHLDDSDTLFGIELLSPKAMAYGAKIYRDSGQAAELMRVLLLPEIKLVGQPHTLITPKTCFEEMQKLTLVREGEEFYIQLQRQISATSSYAQFDFQYIHDLEDSPDQSHTEISGSAYYSVWDTL